MIMKRLALGGVALVALLVGGLTYFTIKGQREEINLKICAESGRHFELCYLITHPGKLEVSTTIAMGKVCQSEHKSEQLKDDCRVFRKLIDARVGITAEP